MQSLNNLSPRGRVLLIGVVSVFILLPLFYFVYSATSNNNPNKPGTYYDKGSGETVTNNKQQPEDFGTDGSTVTYLGTAPLFDIGVTKFQLAATKKALLDFAKTTTDEPSEISINKESISAASYNPEVANSRSEVSFVIQVDRKTKYQIRLQYYDITKIQLYGGPLKADESFKSQEIDGSTITE